MKEYCRNNKGLRIAPTWVLTVSLVSWIISFILVVLGIIFIASKGFEYALVRLSIPFLIILIWGILSDVLFVYEESLKVTIESKKINIEYTLNQDMLPTSKNKVLIEIKNIAKTKVTKKSITIYGDILKKAPMKKPIEMKKYKINTSHFGEEQQNLIKDIKAKEQAQ